MYAALRGPDREFWLTSLIKDLKMLRDKRCVINVTDVRPHGPSPPELEQRFKNKYHGEVPIAMEELDPKLLKTRTVARGDKFKIGVHYDDTASPVVHTSTIKMLLAWGVQKGLLFFQADQESAFYSNPMDRKGVWVKLPPGYDHHSEELRPLDRPPLYGELAMAVPGIPQGSLVHYRDLKRDLSEMNFKPIAADGCLFLHDTIDMATSTHVDDFILAAPSVEHAGWFFGMKGLGQHRKISWKALRSTLGIDFKIDYSQLKRTIFMTQRPFAVTILDRANMTGCNPAKTPAIPGRRYDKADCPGTDEEKEGLRQQGMTKELYHTLTASVNFLLLTRDDLRFIYGKLSKFCANPGLEHFKALKHALRFIAGTLDYGVKFEWCAEDPEPVDGPLTIKAWSDSSFADDVATARTTLGYVIQANGATISASSTVSKRISTCINHAEFAALGSLLDGEDVQTEGTNQALLSTSRSLTWMRGIKAALERRDVTTMPPTPAYVDNAGVISMLQGATIKAANRYIYRELAETRERVHIDKAVVAVKVNTEDNLANCMTKQEKGVDASAAQLRQIAGPA